MKNRLWTMKTCYWCTVHWRMLLINKKGFFFFNKKLKITACGWCWKIHVMPMKRTLNRPKRKLHLIPSYCLSLKKWIKSLIMCWQTIIIFMEEIKNDNRWLRNLQIWRLMGIKHWIKLIIAGYENCRHYGDKKSNRSSIFQPFNHKIVLLCLINIFSVRYWWHNVKWMRLNF